MGHYAVDWRGADLRAGDAIVLALDTYHMTARNLTREARLSCDTRWCAAAGACGFLTLAAHVLANPGREARLSCDTRWCAAGTCRGVWCAHFGRSCSRVSWTCWSSPAACRSS